MSKSDLLGISSSILCLIHCLAFPVILSAGYLLNYAQNGHWHGLDYLFIVLSMIAVWVSARKTTIPALKIAFWMAIFIFSASILCHDIWKGMIYISAATSLLLIALHLIHWRNHLKCQG
ncbi:MAG TPA: MerC domain-containing protein [Cyclobacteriaceae bacterium]|nr:MerC domain-containing protein [Cyclobacteriaceae bacterium]